MTATVTDLFCGAGGSSEGARTAGMQIVMAANHWQTAIDVHQANHPDTSHDCADITQVDPRRYPRTDVLIASPECTNHSQARGVSRKRQDPSLWDAPDPSAERSRARTVGRYRQQWIWACTTCGSTCETATEPAASIIDWRLPCPRIGDRARPLADATRARILAGLQRYGWAPVITAGAGNVYETTPGNRARPLTEPLRVQTATAEHALATAPGFLFQTAHGGRTSGLGAPHPTVCASDDRQALVLANNFGNVPTSIDEPLPTATTGNRHGLIVPLRRNGHAYPTDEPVHTLTAGGTTRDRFALIDLDAIVDDCGFRMLEPHEIAAAMAFPPGYIPDTYTKKDRVKLAGNAVTPPVMTWITGRLLQALEGAA